MMLFLAIAATLAFVVVFLLILFANGMSDAPSSPGLSFLPAWIILAVAVALWVCWYFGWHPSW
jgi:hypothetical protein